LIKKFGAGVMNLPSKNVEAMSIIEDITDSYQVFKMRETNYRTEQKQKLRGNRRW
jgi:hypothetical protein